MFLAINYLEENTDSEITTPRMVAVRIAIPATIIETLLEKYCFSECETECGLRTTWRWCPLVRYRIQKKVVDD